MKKLFQHHARFRPSRDHQQASLYDRNMRGFGNLDPHVARSHGAPPAISPFLASNGNEAKIAHRGAVGAGISVDDNDPFATPRRGKRVGKAANAGAHDSYLKVFEGGCVRQLRGADCGVGWLV
jgi:hypothetical protein